MEVDNGFRERVIDQNSVISKLSLNENDTLA